LNDLTIVAPDGAVVPIVWSFLSQKLSSGKNAQAAAVCIKGIKVIGPLKEMRASQVPRPFQSTREYVSGKVQAGTQQILLLVGPFMLSAQKRLVAEYEEPEVDFSHGGR
jgi:hypothetical protein